MRRRREAREAEEQQSGEVLPCPPTSALEPVASTASSLKSALKLKTSVATGPRKKVSFRRNPATVHETIEMGDPSRGNYLGLLSFGIRLTSSSVTHKILWV